MSEGATSGDRQQQARNNVASRRQSGLEPRPEDLRDAQLDARPRVTPSEIEPQQDDDEPE